MKIKRAISSLDDIDAPGIYCGQNLWGDNTWSTIICVMQSTSVTSPGFIIGLGTSSGAVSIFDRIYYAARTDSGEWNKKIVSI